MRWSENRVSEGGFLPLSSHAPDIWGVSEVERSFPRLVAGAGVGGTTMKQAALVGCGSARWRQAVGAGKKQVSTRGGFDE